MLPSADRLMAYVEDLGKLTLGDSHLLPQCVYVLRMHKQGVVHLVTHSFYINTQEWFPAIQKAQLT
jgi:hypothetical protein